jgi:hypothetical protein
MQDFPNSIIVTVDDDVIYDSEVLLSLYQSYLEFPDCVSCLRAHRITLDAYGKVRKYADWKWEDNSLLHIPSYQAIATGCGGVLYPPNSLNREVFNIKELTARALFADDLWLKVMELLNKTPVVLARPCCDLKYIEGSQDKALFHDNVQNGNNDLIMHDLLKRYSYFDSIDVYSLLNKGN